jgi:dTDP-4-dehydrorhamnose reductase
MKRQRVLLLGANGQVGTELHNLLKEKTDRFELYALRRSDVDFAQPEQLRPIIKDLQPTIILNAAAYTAVDKAESEPELAALINAKAPEIIAEEATRLGALLVHYSTDYVFDGSKQTAWLEDDRPMPLGVYGATKLAGERAIASHGADYLIFRTSWVFSPHGKNFLLTILRLARERDRLTIVDDQRGAPTSALAIATATWQILEKIGDRESADHSGWPGVYHMTCAEQTTWYGFARAIVEGAATLLDTKLPQVDPISSSDYQTPATRPANSILDNSKLHAQFGVCLPAWHEALQKTILDLSVKRTNNEKDREKQ